MKKVQFWQTVCKLSPKPRGFHLITNEVKTAIKDMPNIKIGTLHLFLQHTSASLTISENTCHDVWWDLEDFFNTIAPEEASYRHTLEGEDDMPAHIKNTILGVSLLIPISKSELLLGQWQGIFLCEHRNVTTSRSLVLTVQGSD